jgi:two-component system nitrogen regulation sensor histidine kinase NtrY
MAAAELNIIAQSGNDSAVRSDVAAPPAPTHRWARSIDVAEFAAVISLLVVGVATALLVPRLGNQALLSPVIVSLLLVANLLPAMLLMVFAGRRLARARVRKRGGGEARLHMRLVAIFSFAAAVPTLIVVIFSSYLFQSGMEFWFSDRSRGMFESAVGVAQAFFVTERRDVSANTKAMAIDLRAQLQRSSLDSPDFNDFYVQQVVVRELSESAIIEIGADGRPRSLALIDPDSRAADNRLPPQTVNRLNAGEEVVEGVTGNRVDAAVRLLPDRPVYLYAARAGDLLGTESIRSSRSIFDDYNTLFANSRALQFRFILALYLGALILVGLVILVAIAAAERIVRPIDKLVDAAEAVSGGNLSVHVGTPSGNPDEIALLAGAFNRMTDRLSAQTRDLVDARDQIEQRRAFIEAVMAAVGTGVLSLDDDGRIRFANTAAGMIIGEGDRMLTDVPLAEVAPALAEWVRGGVHDPIMTMSVEGEDRTLSLRLVADGTGQVLTFDDISQQLLDERRAAWSDVARRIAHEVKNPLTPIQLAAERLQRRFGQQVGEGEETFAKLTSTIVRQVGDLRRIIDEFSDFARMPQPQFRLDSVAEALRQSIFLHEVAHPTIAFHAQVEDRGPVLCDRRLLGQAFTNVIKNAVEAIRQRDNVGGEITIRLEYAVDVMTISIADNGIGLPAMRDRITEPYVTAREGGTGLGLAVVRKIVEDHAGDLSFADRPGGGTIVAIILRPTEIHPEQQHSGTTGQ